MTGETYKHGYGPIPMGVLIAILVIAIVAIAAFSLTGDSGDGPAAEAGDSGGGGVNPNPAGADPAVAVEPERSIETDNIKTVVLAYDSSDWLIEEGNKNIPKVYKQAKLNTLYVCKKDVDSDIYTGILIVKKDEMDGRQFVFCGTNVEINSRGEVIFSEINGFADHSVIPLSRLPCIPENYARSIGDGKYVCISLFKEI